MKKKSALRIDGQLVWKDEHEAVFLKAKELLSSVPFLLIPVPSKRFRLEVDACTKGGRGLGAVLKQQDGKGEWRPCAYWSHALTAEERNSYSATMAEAQAMHDAIQHFSQYLRCGPEFEVYTDHRPLIYMVMTAVRTANKVVLRYLINLQEYSFSVTYMKGSLNLQADAVSRMIRYGEPHMHFPKTA